MFPFHAFGGHWSGLQLGIGRKEDYATVLEDASQKRRCLKLLSEEAFELSVLMSNFECSYQKQHFDAALECLSQAIACLEGISS